MSYLEKAKNLQSQIEQGQVLEAFEKYYHENVKVWEMPTGECREGKEAQRKAMEEWQNSIQTYHGSGCNCVTSDEEQGITTAESWVDVTFKGGQRVKMEEVAVQKWQDNQIVEERFYYHNPMPENQ